MVLPPQLERGPRQRGRHHEQAGEVRQAGQRVVPGHQAERLQQVFPVVPFDLRARPAAEEHQLQRPRIVDVGRQVDQVLPGPPGRHRGAETVAAAPERHQAGDRHQHLGRRSAEHDEEAREEPEEDVPGLVEHQVHEVQEGAAGVVRGDAVRGEAQPEPRQDQPQQPAAGERGPVRPRQLGELVGAAHAFGFVGVDLPGRADDPAAGGRRRDQRARDASPGSRASRRSPRTRSRSAGTPAAAPRTRPTPPCWP